MNEEQKREEIAGMFDRIARRYDFLNHFLSLGTDVWWRRRAISAIARLRKAERVLDVATGTGDMAIAALRLNPVSITGIDISPQMLEYGRRKLVRKGLTTKIELVKAASEAIPFGDGSFDVAMSAFGVRNFSDTLKGLTEMNRVLVPGGVIMVLEFSKPSRFPFRQVYSLYFNSVLPFFGRLFSRDSSAYTYLPESVGRFPQGEEFLQLLVNAGFGSPKEKRVSGGIATIYTAVKGSVQ
jgi:demethylmenaquinone methyltransferase / 2-methoxy-6-polyprenyl-1,4-benzoquinol methylase